MAAFNEKLSAFGLAFSRRPLMVAAGLFGADGYGAGIDPDDALFGSVGAVSLKTATLAPRVGNAEPRIYPALGAASPWLMNSVGLENPGIEAVLGDVVPRWSCRGFGVVVSIAADTVDGWAELAELTDRCLGVSAVELNLSCPNVEGGLACSHDLVSLGAAVAAARYGTRRPVWAKLSPGVADIGVVAQAAVAAGADALVVCNTMPALALDALTGVPALGAGYGGLSGEALRPVAVGLVRRVWRAVDVPVVGVGGVATGRHVLEFVRAGASAVQVGTALLADCGVMRRIAGEFRELLAQVGAGGVAELVGSAKV